MAAPDAEPAARQVISLATPLLTTRHICAPSPTQFNGGAVYSKAFTTLKDGPLLLTTPPFEYDNIWTVNCEPTTEFPLCPNV